MLWCVWCALLVAVWCLLSVVCSRLVSAALSRINCRGKILLAAFSRIDACRKIILTRHAESYEHMSRAKRGHPITIISCRKEDDMAAQNAERQYHLWTPTLNRQSSARTSESSTEFLSAHSKFMAEQHGIDVHADWLACSPAGIQ